MPSSKKHTQSRSRKLARAYAASRARKNREKKKRSLAARKGWRTRRRGWSQSREIRTGYDSRTPGNSYCLTIHIRPHKRLSDSQVFDLIETLTAEGHFDQFLVDLPDAPADLGWATFHNSQIVTKRGFKMKKGTAILIDFERSAP